jgi:hypothetical protein
MDNSYDEKRKYAREPADSSLQYTVKAPIAVRLKMGNLALPAMICDIGEGGVGVISQFQIPEKTILFLKFTVINTVTPNKECQECRQRDFVIEGQVCYCRPIDKENYRLGINFLDLAPDDRAFIADYVAIKSASRTLQPPNTGLE